MQGCFDLYVTTFHHGLMEGTVSAVLVVAKPAAEPTRALRCIHNVSINLHYTIATSLPMACIFPALPDGSGASKTHLHGYEVYAKLLLTPSFNPVSRGNLGILPNVALNFNQDHVRMLFALLLMILIGDTLLTDTHYMDF